MRNTVFCAVFIFILLLAACGQANVPVGAVTGNTPIATLEDSPSITATAAESPAANTASPTASPAAVAPLGEPDLVFTLNGKPYQLKTDAKPLLDALGKGYKLTQSPSCLYKGNDKTFEYADITIQTFPLNGKDIIDEIDITSPDYPTARGVKAGDTLDQVKAAYGEGYDNGGVLEYVLGGDPTDLKSPMVYFQTGDDGTVSLIGLYSASNIQ
jgi:hypothetical protein